MGHICHLSSSRQSLLSEHVLSQALINCLLHSDVNFPLLPLKYTQRSVWSNTNGLHRWGSKSFISTIWLWQMQKSFALPRRCSRCSNISQSSSDNMRVPVLNTGSICACAPCGLLESHTAVRYAFSLFLQLRAGDASIGWPQQDVTCAVADTTSGAGTKTQTPGWPGRHFTVQWCRWVEGKEMWEKQCVWVKEERQRVFTEDTFMQK